MQTQLSLDAQLFFWWDSLLPGHGATMGEMQSITGVADPQSIRNALVRLRKGEVKDPSSSKETLRRRPIRYNTKDRRYYDLSRVTGNLVASQVPGMILAEAVRELVTRAITLESAMGADGLALSAEEYLSDPELRELIGQLPIRDAWKVHEIIFHITQARQLLAIEEARRMGGQLPGPTTP
jgi:hypothetical protein